jgi:AcrR family transcriptional regulator
MALSRDRILATAQRVVAADGLDALSMRRLAQELDVWPMALYRHFQDKEALLDALAAPVPVDGTDVRAFAAQLRRALAAQPPALRARSAARDEPALRERGLGLLAREGYEDAAERWAALHALAVGFAATGGEEDAFGAALERLLAR